MPVSLSTVSGKSIMLSVSCVERGVTRGAGTSVFTPDRDVMSTAVMRKSRRSFYYMILRLFWRPESILVAWMDWAGYEV